MSAVTQACCDVAATLRIASMSQAEVDFLRAPKSGTACGNAE